MLQGKIVQGLAQLPVKFQRTRVTQKRLRSVRIVDRGGRAHVIRLAALGVHRKPHGRGQGVFVVREQIPNLRPVDALVRRGPHLHLPPVAPIKAVGHHPVHIGQPARGHIRLHRASKARETRRKFGDLAPRHELP